MPSGVLTNFGLYSMVSIPCGVAERCVNYHYERSLVYVGSEPSQPLRGVCSRTPVPIGRCSMLALHADARPANTLEIPTPRADSVDSFHVNRQMTPRHGRRPEKNHSPGVGCLTGRRSESLRTNSHFNCWVFECSSTPVHLAGSPTAQGAINWAKGRIVR
jgi:hypothetical protein